MTFLFDIGNVLLKLHFERLQKTIFGHSESSLPTILAPINESYEVGDITCHEFVSRSLAALDTSLTRAEFIAAWNNIFSLNEPMWDVARNLRRDGHRLILFSNTNTIHARHFLEEYEEFSLFDHHHFSQEIGSNKPHDHFYQKAVDQYHLIPQETFYLDDLDANIATGRRFGFQSWQYDLNDHEACLDWLASTL
ncbi:MAG: HAD-IA family hydrolase [Akkermansiaceae bacterium]|nr:HAD-IA family hydrolase [Akkermansiaceae bacterium]